MWEEVELLEDHAHAPTDSVDVAVGIGHLVATDGDRPTGRLLEEVDAAQERRLARARWADDTDDLSLADRRVEASKDVVGAERLVEVSDLDDGDPEVVVVLVMTQRSFFWRASMRRTRYESGRVMMR